MEMTVCGRRHRTNIKVIYHSEIIGESQEKGAHDKPRQGRGTSAMRR